MKRVIIYCEGQSEEAFVKQMIASKYNNENLYIAPHNFKGVNKYKSIRHDLINIAKKDRNLLVTTMIDYYRLPKDTPGLDYVNNNIYEVASHIEEEIKKDIGLDNIFPYIMMHEFEALLFSDPDAFSIVGFKNKEIKELHKIRSSFDTPEHINNHANTAPSKRILSIRKDYQKRIDGNVVAKRIGLDRIRNECKHFDRWLDKITYCL